MAFVALKQIYTVLKVVISLMCWCVLLFPANAQKSNDTNQQKVDIRTEQQLKGGAIGHTNGWGIGVLYGRQENKDVTNLYSFDYLFSLKHPKETKVVNPGFDQANPYVFSRKNALMLARFGIGRQIEIADKQEAIGVRIDWNYLVGPNLGLLKPDYIELLKDKDNGETVKKTVRYKPQIHNNQGNIFGGAPYVRGLSEISVKPGLSAKTSFSFAWGEDRERFKSIEAGIMVDAFIQRMPIFYFEKRKNKRIFVNLYVSLSFGKHW